jgi:hypothetical protein
MLPPSRRQAAIRAAVAALLLVGAVINLVAAQFFPDVSHSPERYIAVQTSVMVIAAAVLTAIFARLAATRRSVPVRPVSSPGSNWPLPVLGFALSTLIGLIWLFFVLGTIIQLISDGRADYIVLSGVVMITAIPWLVGIMMSTFGLRAAGRLAARFGRIGVGIGLIIWLSTVATSLIFAAG